MHTASRVLFGLTASSLLVVSDAFFSFGCTVIQTARIDPVVSPGQVSGHAHKIVGAQNVNANSTSESLWESSCTSCEIQDDKSAYWTPQLYYQHSNGSFQEVPNNGMSIYYFGNETNPASIVPFPAGFRMLSGDPTLRSYDTATLTQPGGSPVADRVTFNCIKSSGSLPETHSMENTDCEIGMRAQVSMQSCWDGVNLYLEDQSHVAYLSGINSGDCPSTHPVSIPSLFLETLYQVNSIDKSDGGQFVFSNGDTTGYGFHGDFLNGWNQDVLQSAVTDCLSADNNGVLSSCAVLEASVIDNYGQVCPEQPSVVDEAVHGMLAQLPGCNAVTSGPEMALQLVCAVNSTEVISISSGPMATATPAPSSSSLLLSATSTADVIGTVSRTTAATATSTPAVSATQATLTALTNSASVTTAKTLASTQPGIKTETTVVIVTITAGSAADPTTLATLTSSSSSSAIEATAAAATVAPSSAAAPTTLITLASSSPSTATETTPVAVANESTSTAPSTSTIDPPSTNTNTAANSPPSVTSPTFSPAARPTYTWRGRVYT